MKKSKRFPAYGAIPEISPYLLRPLRSYRQVLEDIEAAKRRAEVVTILVHDQDARECAPKPSIAA